MTERRSVSSMAVGAATTKDWSLFEKMLLIRRTEERILDLFAKGRLNGTTHTSIGQEACAVGVVSALDVSKDIVVSNHRCHGHFLAYGGPVDLLVGEIMGRANGACSGIGGSQHLHYRSFYANGVLGGMVAAATGMALAEKMQGTDAIVCCFLGDGALGEGIVYESFNMASLWRLPVLFVIEANGYAQSTPTALGLAGSLVDRPRAFGIETSELNVDSVRQVYDAAEAAVGRVRTHARPECLVLNTYRLAPHSKGDDTRPTDEIARAAAVDPLHRQLATLPRGLMDEAEQQIAYLLDECVRRCEQAEALSVEGFFDLVHVG